MAFKLNDYHIDISDEDLIIDVLRVASIIGSPSLTADQYKTHGKYGNNIPPPFWQLGKSPREMWNNHYPVSRNCNVK